VDRNPEEGNLFEGDILLLPGQLDKNGQLLDVFRWPNATVYYSIEGTFGKNAFNFLVTTANLNY
jgi:hypothetical protein